MKLKDLKKQPKISLKPVEMFNEKTLRITNFQHGEYYKFLVNPGDNVLVYSPILEGKNGQKILSPISGKVKNIENLENYNGEVFSTLILENDLKFLTLNPKKTKVSNKDELVKICKDFGIINNEVPVYKFFENINETLIISAFEEKKVYNYKSIYLSEENKKEKYNIKLKEILNLKNIYIVINKTDKVMFNYLSGKYNLLNEKVSPNNCMNIEDLLNLYNALFENKPQITKYISVCGGALKSNAVVKTYLGVSLESIVEKLGDFKENIEEIKDYKELAKASVYDKYVAKQNMKKAKYEEKEKLKKEYVDISNKSKLVIKQVNKYYIKYHNCFGGLSFNGKKDNLTENYKSLHIQSDVFAVHFLNNFEIK